MTDPFLAFTRGKMGWTNLTYLPNRWIHDRSKLSSRYRFALSALRRRSPWLGAVRPDVIVKPPLPCGTRRTTSGQNADLWEVKATRPEWRCRWCDLGHYRLDRPNDCPYCCARWEAKESMTFESGEAAVQMRCRCGCDAEWYTARGWGETTDYRLRGSSLVTASIKTDDVGKCAFCGADTFDFVHRPDGFFRRCSGCNAIHRWR